jgi:hypothetical protein
MDSNYKVIDTLMCGNGYPTDNHELQLLKNGHFYIIAYECRTLDMSELVEGGNPQAKVEGNYIQEIDRDGKVIYHETNKMMVIK